MVQWTYNEDVTDEEFLARFADKFIPIMNCMQDCEGDLMMSDYRELLDLFWKMKRYQEARGQTND